MAYRQQHMNAGTRPNVYAVADGVVIRYAYFWAGTYALEYFMGTASVDTETNRLTQTGNMTYDYVPSGNFHRRRDLLDSNHFAELPIW